MKKIAVFYHARLSGGTPAVSPAWARSIMAEQMDLLVASGLYENANEIFIGLNQERDESVLEMIPPGSNVLFHGDDAQSELPTMHALQEWLPGHEDWNVCYWHAKGATHSNDVLVKVWRHCMERVVIHNWRSCIADMRSGYDTVGAHWLTHDQYPDLVKTWFWGGNFWWAKASFLSELPALPRQAKCRDDFFIAENWIGFGRRPHAKDYAPHWPNIVPCSK